MLKRFAALFLSVLLCGVVLCASAEEIAWNERAVWVVYDGELDCVLDDGTRMRFVIDYRSPAYEEGAMNCFWLAYVPDQADTLDAAVYIALGPDEHSLVFCDDGGYRLLIEETALREAYEFWLTFQTAAGQE